MDSIVWGVYLFSVTPAASSAPHEADNSSNLFLFSWIWVLYSSAVANCCSSSPGAWVFKAVFCWTIQSTKAVALLAKSRRNTSFFCCLVRSAVKSVFLCVISWLIEAYLDLTFSKETGK